MKTHSPLPGCTTALAILATTFALGASALDTTGLGDAGPGTYDAHWQEGAARFRSHEGRIEAIAAGIDPLRLLVFLREEHR